jgi:hypothetical protein
VQICLFCYINESPEERFAHNILQLAFTSCRYYVYYSVAAAEAELGDFVADDTNKLRRGRSNNNVVRVAHHIVVLPAEYLFLHYEISLVSGWDHRKHTAGASPP